MDTCASKQDFVVLTLSLIPFLVVTVASLIVNIRVNSDLIEKLDHIRQAQDRRHQYA